MMFMVWSKEEYLSFMNVERGLHSGRLLVKGTNEDEIGQSCLIPMLVAKKNITNGKSLLTSDDIQYKVKNSQLIVLSQLCFASNVQSLYHRHKSLLSYCYHLPGAGLWFCPGANFPALWDYTTRLCKEEASFCMVING